MLQGILNKRIFLSYAWGDSDLADEIDNVFKLHGILLIRDIHDVDSLENIKSFMKRIKNANSVIMIISDTCLRSKNCMYELKELTKCDEFAEKIVPIRRKNANFFCLEEQEIYYKYWDSMHKILRKKASKLPIQAVAQDLRIIEDIKHYLFTFFERVVDIKCVEEEESRIEKILDLLIKKHAHGYRVHIESVSKIFNGEGDYESKEVLLNEYILRHQLNNDFHISQAKAWLAQKCERYSLAKQYLEMSIADYPIDPHTHHVYADLCAEKLNYNVTAKKHYSISLQLDDTNSDVYNDYASILIQEKDWIEAENLLLQSYNLNPAYHITNYYLGLVNGCGLKKSKKALQYFLNALLSTSNMSLKKQYLHHVIESMLLIKPTSYSQLINYLVEYSQYEDFDEELVARCVAVMARENEIEDCIDIIKIALENDNAKIQNFRLFELFTRVFCTKSNVFDHLMSLIELLDSKNALNSSICMTVAVYFMSSKKLDDAQQLFEKCVSFKNCTWYKYFNFAEFFYYERGDKKKALEYYVKAFEHNPDVELAFERVAMLIREVSILYRIPQNKYKDILNKCVQTYPENAMINYSYAIICENLHESLYYFEKAYEKKLNFPAMYLNYAHILVEKFKDTKKALQVLKTGIANGADTTGELTAVFENLVSHEHMYSKMIDGDGFPTEKYYPLDPDSVNIKIVETVKIHYYVYRDNVGEINLDDIIESQLFEGWCMDYKNIGRCIPIPVPNDVDFIHFFTEFKSKAALKRFVKELKECLKTNSIAITDMEYSKKNPPLDRGANPNESPMIEPFFKAWPH